MKNNSFHSGWRASLLFIHLWVLSTTPCFLSNLGHGEGGSMSPGVNRNPATPLDSNSPPVFLIQPQSKTVNDGADVCFSASALGTAPIEYQWFFNDEIISASNSLFCLTSVSSNNAGAYYVVASNIDGMATSAVAVLTVTNVSFPPAFTTDPQSQTVDAGAYVCFSGAVVGTPPISYQWQFNEGDIPKATNTSWCLSSVSSNQAGDYRLVASNIAGVATSATATLTVVCRAPQFTRSPTNQTVIIDSYAYFSCSAVGSPTIRYQWLCNGQPMPGYTTSSTYLYLQSTNQTGDYSVVASNACGVLTSAVARLTVVIDPPHFHVQPLSQSVIEGGHMQFFTEVGGTPPITYQWWYNGHPVPYATYSTLYLYNVTSNQAGEYTLVARNDGGATTSAVARLTVVPPGLLDIWEWRNPLPQGNDLYSVTFGGNLFSGGTFVAVGDYGTILASPDGTNWTLCSLDLPLSLNGVAYGDGRFVAVGSEYNSQYPYVGADVILTSPDGYHWTRQYREATIGLRGVAFANHQFVAFGSCYGDEQNWVSTILTSSDGVNWAMAYGTDGDSEQQFFSISYAGGKFLIGGRYLVGGIPFILLSSDGLHWSQGGLPAYANSTLKGVTFNGARYVACGDGGGIFYSSDAWSWTQCYAVPADPYAYRYLSCIAYEDGLFTAFGYRYTWTNGSAAAFVLTSPDGLNWTESPTPPEMIYPNAIVYAPSMAANVWVLVGHYGNIATSPDRRTWVARSKASSNNLRGVGYGNGLFVVVGNNGTNLTSTDGVSWTGHPSLTQHNLHDVCYGLSQFVTVGGGGTVLQSSDALEWTACTSGTAVDLFAITYGRGKFVAVGGGRGYDDDDHFYYYWYAILTSTDGQHWTSVAGSGYRLHGITYGNGLFVAVGEPGKVVTSPDGITWTAQTGTFGYLKGVAYGNGLFVAVSESSYVFTSTNGIAWESHPWPANVPWAQLDEITFGLDCFVAVGDTGTILTSTNGIDWLRRRSPTSTNLRGIAYSSDNYVIVGNNDIILQSGTNRAPHILVQPQDQTVLIGGTATFSVGLVGPGPFNYQWRKSASPIPGATNSTYRIIGAQTNDSGVYSVVVWDENGVTYSAEALLSVIPLTVPYALNAQELPWLNYGHVAWFAQTATNHDGLAAAQSGPISNNQTSVVEIIVNAGPYDLSFWWKVSSETNNDQLLFMTNGVVAAGISGNVDWEKRSFRISYGTQRLTWCYTKNATLSFGRDCAWLDEVSLDPPGSPFIIYQPPDRVGAMGSNVTFSVSVAGAQPLWYQWYYNDTNLIAWAQGPALTLTNVQGSDAGTYHVVILNTFGSAVSRRALLEVLNAPVIIEHPQTQFVTVGSDVVFTVTTTGSLPINYRWRHGQVTLTNMMLAANTCSYYVPHAQPSDSGYYLAHITNRAGYATGGQGMGYTYNAWLTVVTPPTNQQVSAGSTVTLQGWGSCSTNVLGYQWLFNGAAIPGATSSNLVITNIQCGQAGTYTLLVTNPIRRTASYDALLTVWGCLRIAQLASNVVLHWTQSSPYVLEQTESLAPPDWTPVTDPVEQNGDDCTIPLPISGPSRFYRLRPSTPIGP